MIKIGSFFEEHIEKVVFGIVGLVCFWLLITRVLFSPNVLEYNNEKFSPGAIDKYIKRQAKELEEKLNGLPDPAGPFKSQLPVFVDMFNSPIKNIDLSVVPSQPQISKTGPKRSYRLPQIGSIGGAEIEHIRAVFYVPIGEIMEAGTRSQAEYEPNDVDFVTVESSIDAVGLYERFHESFAGDDLKERWRDPCLARPIFAAVQLQRQELGDDGNWSVWQEVPRIKIEARAELFEVIENVSDLPAGGLAVRLLQYGEKDVQMALLQPEAYQIASANEQWFPPVLHEKFLEIQEAQAKQERREALEAEKEEREQGRDDRRGGGGRLGDTRTRSSGYGSGTSGLSGVADSLYSSGGTRTRSTRGSDSRITGRSSDGRSRRRSESDEYIDRERELLARKKELSMGPTIDEVYDEFNQIMITPMTDLSKASPLAFWAHDDTADPGKSYRYRIRLGVFNPIAGTEQFDSQYVSRKDDVILWSEFSQVTEVVSIPGRMYFFAKGIQEAAKTVTVQVSKLVLGSWYSKDFPVKQGEVIGGIVESETKKPTSIGGIGGLRPSYRLEDDVREPEVIDYDTGAVMVDVVAVNDWLVGSKMRERRYFDMLYSFDGAIIEHMPVKNSYWASDLQAAYNEIRKLQSEPREEFRPFGSSGTGVRSMQQRTTTGGYDLYDEDDERLFEERIMYERGRR